MRFLHPYHAYFCKQEWGGEGLIDLQAPADISVIAESFIVLQLFVEKSYIFSFNISSLYCKVFFLLLVPQGLCLCSRSKTVCPQFTFTWVIRRCWKLPLKLCHNGCILTLNRKVGLYVFSSLSYTTN